MLTDFVFLRRSGVMLPRKNVFDIKLPKVPFPEFLSHSDRIFTDCPSHFPDFNLESLIKFFSFFNKNVFIIKNLPDFRKTVETSMDPRLVWFV